MNYREIKKMKKNIACILLAATFVGCGSKGGTSLGDNEFPVATITTQSASVSSSYPATIKGIQDVEIRPKVSGFITKICVKQGQTVSAGQLLFVIDNETYQAAVRQAQATLNTARAQMNTAKLTYENSKQLAEKNVIGQYELQSAQNSYLSTQAQVAQAEATLASAKETLSYCYVKSPSAGVIGDLPYKVGALVSGSSAQPLTTVSNISTMEVYFSMTESDLLTLTKQAGGLQAAIKDYPPVELKLADGSIYPHKGQVAKISGVIDETTGSVSVIAQFANPEHLLKSGGSGSIVVTHTDNQAIVIPQSYTTEVQNKIFVYLCGSDNKAHYTEISVDPQDDGVNFIVTGGLKVGDRIVTKGLTKLTDGMEIKPITDAQYDKKVNDAQQLGKNQNSASGFANSMSGSQGDKK